MKLLLLHRLRELRMFRLKKKMKFNETVTASSSSGASNVHISDACNFWYLFFKFNQL
jgi:hypothetical protein